MGKKRANGDGSIYQTTDGTWKAVLSFGSIGGKRIRRSKNAKTRAQARDKLDELRREVFGESPESMTVAALLTRWLDEQVEPNREETTLANYRFTVENHIVPAIGPVAVAAVKPYHVTNMLTKSKGGAATKKLIHTVSKSAFSWAVTQGFSVSNPCSELKRPPHRRKKIQPFTADESERILEATAGHRLHAAFRIALTVGLRQGELFGLQWRDVDFKNGKLTVERQAREISGRVELVPPKTEAGERTIALTPATLDSLHERRKRAILEGTAKRSDLVFTSTTGKVIVRSNFGNRTWKPLLKKLGIDHRGFHHTRHTAATDMLSDGVPIHEVAGILGHSRPSTLLDLYAHWIPSEQSKAIQAMQKRHG